MVKQPSEVLGVKIVGGLRETSTPWAGVFLLVELFRCFGVEAIADKALPVKGSAKELKQSQTVESFVLLSALGGDCVEDMQRSTLLMLVAAFVGTDLVKRAYREAIAHRYRFYSFGDALLIL